MAAYYNENDMFAATWLRELIKAGLIAPGDVDTRSIEDVRPDDLRGYVQHHFFAGIGVWSYALRLAGWPDDRPIWTGSCPCQPFSAAGKRGGAEDKRHLWPAWSRLVRECRPDTIIGEQVEGAVRLGWLDLVFGDLEREGYACGAAVFGAHSVGAPHIRQRLYWLADAQRGGRESRPVASEGAGAVVSPENGELGRLADADLARLEGGDRREMGNERAATERGGGDGGVGNATICRSWALDRKSRSSDGQQKQAGRPDLSGRLADDTRGGRQEERALGDRRAQGDCPQRLPAGLGAGSADRWSRATAGFWRDPDWLYCRDGKWRPVESGTFPLVDGAPARMGRLRGYGNAIVAEQAATFVRAFMLHEIM